MVGQGIKDRLGKEVVAHAANDGDLRATAGGGNRLIVALAADEDAKIGAYQRFPGQRATRDAHDQIGHKAGDDGDTPSDSRHGDTSAHVSSGSMMIGLRRETMETLTRMSGPPAMVAQVKWSPSSRMAISAPRKG